jgi:DNA-binding response OmpR family regulator
MELLRPPRVMSGHFGGKQIMSELPVILVVEDDQLLQAFVEQALTDGGFDAAVAASGEEAVTLLTGNKGKYRALVTDINLLGKMDGWEVAQRAREIDHAFPVIYMSGAHAEDWSVKGVPNSIMLAKPFAPAQLVTALAQLLNAAPPPATPGT